MKRRGWQPPALLPTDSRGRPRGGRWRGRIRIPQHAHPLVRQLIAIMNDQHVLRTEVAARAGLSICGMRDWSMRKSPQVVTLEAAANVLGYRLALVPISRGRDV